MAGFIKFTTQVVGIDRNTAYIRGQLAYAAFLITAAGVAPIETAMRYYVPIDTGDLHESIHHEVIVEMPTRCMMAVGPDDSMLSRGSNSHYAEDVEFGTRYQHAQPFIRVGFDTARDAAIRDMSDEARDAIKEIMMNVVVGRGNK